ncbi:hypothetical protein C8R44DRAFT_841541 [Mycena epipterygia]|nr:hypothetical protein C8R44DRAFT_841541 [Mycena epipterygia]
MLPLHYLLFGLFAVLFVSAAPTLNALEKRDLLGQIIDALGIGLVTSINVFITLDSLVTNLAIINFEAKNPLLFELTLDSVSTQAGLNGTVYATFQHTFPKPVVVRPLKQANSGDITDVLLTQGAIISLSIIPLGILDLINVDVNVRALTIDGIGGIPLVISGLHQASVPTTYTLDLSD